VILEGTVALTSGPARHPMDGEAAARSILLVDDDVELGQAMRE